jgi:hypothetical protein
MTRPLLLLYLLLMERSRRIPLYGFVALVAAALFIALHPIIVPYFTTRFIGGSYGDGGLYVWLVQSFISDPGEALRLGTHGFYPYPLTRAWSDSFLLPSAIASLLLHLGLSLPAAYNVVIVLTFGLNAAAVCALACTVGLSPLAGALAGITFANSSYILGNLGHPQLLFFFWIPLAWSLVLHSGSARPAARNWALAGLCISGAFYCGVYYAIFGALGLATIWCWELLSGSASQRRLLRILLFATFGAIPIAYALPEYLAVQSYFGKRGLYEAADFAASGLSYLSFSPHNDLFGKTALVSHAEALLCPGYAALLMAILSGFSTAFRHHSKGFLILAASVAILGISSSIIDSSTVSETIVCASSWLVLVVALWVARTLPKGAGVLFLITTIFFVFSFGPGGNPAKHEPAWTPFASLYSVFPGLASIRAVSRFGSVVVMGLLLLAFRLCQELLTSRQTNSGIRLLLASSLVGAVLAENSTSTIPLDTVSARPQAFDFVASQGSLSAPTLVLPFSGTLTNGAVESWSELALISTEYAQWAAPLGLRLVNGYSGQRSKLQQELPKALYNFPSPEAFAYVSRICGLRWIIVAPSFFKERNPEEFTTQLASFPSQVRAITTRDDGSMAIELTPAATTTTEPFFAPAHRQVHFGVEVDGNAACPVTIEGIGRDPSGSIVTLANSSQVVTAPSIVKAPLPSLTRTASPQILRIRAESCRPKVYCEVQ